jgi:hypothetical protein
MKLRDLALGGAAAILLLVGTPVLAQTAPSNGGLHGWQGNPPQVSSPAEKEETRKLNLQAVNGTTESPAALNGESSDISAGAPNAVIGQNQDPQYPPRSQQ